MNEQEFSPLWWFVIIPLGFVILFPIYWCIVVWLISHVGGWQRLAQGYATTLPAAGQQWISQYGFVSRARYRNALNLTANETGLFLEVVPLFRFNHPRLFIPWHDLHNPRPVTKRQHNLIQVDVGQPRFATLSLPAGIFAQSAGRRVLVQ